MLTEFEILVVFCPATLIYASLLFIRRWDILSIIRQLQDQKCPPTDYKGTPIEQVNASRQNETNTEQPKEHKKNDTNFEQVNASQQNRQILWEYIYEMEFLRPIILSNFFVNLYLYFFSHKDLDKLCLMMGTLLNVFVKIEYSINKIERQYGVQKWSLWYFLHYVTISCIK